MRKICFSALFLSSFWLGTVAHAQVPSVLATIRPIHSLAASIMAGVGTPELLTKDISSVHRFQLKPSSIQSIVDADLVLWVSPTLETFLNKPLKTFKIDAFEGQLIQAEGVRLLELRDDHDHHHDDEHGHKDDHKDEHDHGHDDEHGHKDAHKDEHDHGHEHEHHKGMDLETLAERDAHIWLDPKNAVAMAQHIQELLSAKDPQNAQTYKKNFVALREDLHDLQHELEDILQPVKDHRVMVMHDAFQYFTEALSTPVFVPISLHFEGDLSAADIQFAEQEIKQDNIQCLFSEPQYPEKIVRTIAETSGIKSGLLDPLGKSISPGAGLYSQLLRDLATSLRDCLTA